MYDRLHIAKIRIVLPVAMAGQVSCGLFQAPRTACHKKLRKRWRRGASIAMICEGRTRIAMTPPDKT